MPHFYRRCLVLICGLFLLSVSGQAQTSEGLVPDSTELRVLRQFYHATGGPTWLNRTNWLTGTTLAEAATWVGVTVSGGDVVRLTLPSNGLTGTLPPSLGELRGLQHLELVFNGLRGALPATLGQLSRLQFLWIGANQLTGTLPAELGQLRELTYLDLGRNQLTGPIPPTLGQLTKLGLLIISVNQLTGPLPAELGQLGLLDHLSLHSNRLSGPLPTSLGQLQRLTKLQLHNNRFTGAVPAGLAQLPGLTSLNVASNRLTQLPTWSSARAITTLSTASNYLTFGSLEPNFAGPSQPVPAGFTYAPQLPPGPADTLHFVHGAAAVRATRLMGGRYNHYQWERRVGQLWVELPGQASATADLGPGSEALEGEYRARVTNDWVTGLTLYTKTLYLSQLPYAPLATNEPKADNCPPLVTALAPTSRGTAAQDPVNYVRTFVPRVPLTELTAPAATSPGSILRELWTDIDQPTVAAIPVHQLPRSTSLVTELATPNSSQPNYGARFRGYLVPPASGVYAFQIAGDDHCELWLSPSDDPAQRVRLAHVPGSTFVGQWTKYPAQQSAPVSLLAGRRYYLEVLHKQGGDSESGHVAVRWQRPGAPGFEAGPIAGAYLAPYQPTLGTGPSAPVFYRALNLGGGSVLLDGVRFEQASEALNFTLQGTYFGDGSQPLRPAVAEPGRVELIRTAAFDNNLTLTLSQVPSGTYEVFAYVWEDDVAQTLTFTLNGQPVLRDYPTGPAGTWRRLGPFTTTVTAGTLRFAGSGGEVVVSALEVWRLPALRPKEELQITTQYLDGLGRPVQAVQRQASPTGRDLVQVQEYDALGREPKQFLPYSAAATPQGAYRPDARHEQYTFYAGGSPDPQVAGLTATLPRTGVAFAETGFEPSPLNRVLAQASPGESWRMASGRAVTAAERPNTAADSVRRWRPGYGTEREDLTYQGFYAPGELWVKQSQDEQKQTAREFTDKEGRVILKQVAQQGGNTPGKWLSTYYVPDDFGRLRAVLPPKAYQLIRKNNGQVTGARVERLLFRYHYDAQGRVTEKQVPDQAGYQYTVYDALDRPILTQDVAQQARQEWVVTKYDALGRVVYTALGRFPNLTGRAEQQRAELQRQADQATAQHQPLFEQPRATPQLARAYYSDQAYPRLSSTSDAQLLTVNYYDSYDFDQNGQADASYQAPTAAELACAAGEVPQADLRVTGQLTRTLVRVLGQPDAAPGAWLTTTSFFDDKLRPIQVVSTNARGGQDVVSTRFDFTGQALATHTRHRDPQQARDLLVREQRRFDHLGRLLTLTQELAGAAPQVLARHTYNELGQLAQKQLGGTLPPAAAGTAGAVPLPSDAGPAPLQRVDYRYNVRGWLTQLNDLAQPALHGDLWSFALSYDCGFQLPQYNGNIAGQRWRSAQDGIERAYGYRYDDLSRLVQGDFVARAGQSPTAGWSAERGNYRFWAASYDAGGNLLTLRRRGLVQPASRRGAAQYAETDNLRYRYQPPSESPDPQSNRLLRVDDLAPAPTAFGRKVPQRPDFTDGATSGATTPDYGYDAAGSLTSDRNKGLTSIRYNYLHLPERLEWSNGNVLEYRYAATGQKVAKLAYEGSKPAVKTDYAGPWQYERDSLRWLTHSEGRALLQYRKDAAGQPRTQVAYEYTLKDHLGNLRVAFHPGERKTYVAMLDSDADQTRREQQQFDSVSVSYPIRQVVGRQFAYGGDGVALLHAGGTQPRPLGPLKQLVVSRGDTVDVTAFGMYQQPVRNAQWSFALASFVASLVQQQPAALPAGDGTTRKVRVLPLLSVGLGLVPAVRQLVQGVPTAYLRVLVYNQDSVVVAHHEEVLSAAARGGYERLYKRVLVPRAGYVQAYVANESEQEVYFDNVTVEHRQGLQVQENHYDPFGLDLVGLSRSPGLKDLNQYSWNSKEKQAEFGLNWHDHGWRFYEPALGRWVVTDPDAEEAEQESWTTYQFGMDNALRYNDLDGRCPGGCPTSGADVAADLRSLVDAGVNAVNNWLDTPVSSAGANGLTQAAFGTDAETRRDVIGAAAVQFGKGVAYTTELRARSGNLPGSNMRARQGGTSLQARATAIQNAQPNAVARNRSTTATARVKNPDGTTSVLVGSSRNRLTPAQRAALKPGEVEAKGKGHAEVTVINAATSNGQTVEAVAASRPICQGCATSINDVGAKAVSPLKEKRGVPFQQ